MADTLSVFGITYQNVSGFKAKDSNNNTLTFIKDTGGGGGGGIPLLNTITVSSNTRAVNIDMTNYSSYDFVMVIFDTLTVSPSGDWLYFVPNGSEPSGGSYTNSLSTYQGVAILWTKLVGSSNTVCVIPSSSGANAPNVESTGLSNVYLYTYTSSKYIAAGSTIKIYGGNYADL